MLKIRKSNFITRILSFSFNLKSVKSSSPLHLTFAICFYLSLSSFLTCCLQVFLDLFMSFSLAILCFFRSLYAFSLSQPFSLAVFQISLGLFRILYAIPTCSLLGLFMPFLSLSVVLSLLLSLGLFSLLQVFLDLFRPFSLLSYVFLGLFMPFSLYIGIVLLDLFILYLPLPLILII